MEITPKKTQVTPRFYLVLAMALICFAIGVSANQLVAIQFSIFLAFLLVWSFILSKLNFRPLTLERTCPERVFAREPFPVEVVMESVIGTTPIHCLEYSDELFGNGAYHSGAMSNSAVQASSADAVEVSELSAVDGVALTRICTLRNRGVYGTFQGEVVSRFPFGLFERVRRLAIVQDELTVYPHPARPPVLQTLFAVGIGAGNDNDHFRREMGGEFRGLRAYDHGDPVKLIHWPLSARYQNLVVKDFDPVAPEEIIIVFHSFWPDDSKKRMTSPEYALQVLSGMFLTLHENGTDFSFFSSFNDWEEIRVAEDPETLVAGLESLARADVKPMPTLEPLTDLIEQLPEDDRRVIVFSNTPKRYWHRMLGDDNALICLDCRLELDFGQLSAGSRQRRLQGVAL